MNGALAIFAKTSSLSPVKTRLAADIGTVLADAFYALSLECTKEMAQAIQKQRDNTLTPYWALAEKEALTYPQWLAFDMLWTGEGNLGERLHNIYNTLQKKHDYVVLIGTDSPQLEPECIEEAIRKLAAHPESCVIGPALDGGFYLFAAKTAIPEDVWVNVTYSKETTLEALTSNLHNRGVTVQSLPTRGDIDTVQDFKPLMNALDANHHLLPAQKTLHWWLLSQTEMFQSRYVKAC